MNPEERLGLRWGKVKRNKSSDLLMGIQNLDITKCDIKMGRPKKIAQLGLVSH